jgi:hypothetical protein
VHLNDLAKLRCVKAGVAGNQAEVLFGTRWIVSPGAA